MNLRYAIVPDVHGRQFWKHVKDFDGEIIFLGDYIDPYSDEGITRKQAIDNFLEILDFASENKNVTMLLGNHDATYMFSKNVCKSRCDYNNYQLLQEIYREHKDLFKMIKTEELNGEKMIFSHAGLHPWWLQTFKKYDECFLENFNFKSLNEYLQNKDFVNAISAHHFLFRGGDDKVGSPIWCDIREFINTDLSNLNFKQYVGHTQLVKDPMRWQSVYCLDTRNIYYLTEDNILLDNNLEEPHILELKVG